MQASKSSSKGKKKELKEIQNIVDGSEGTDQKLAEIVLRLTAKCSEFTRLEAAHAKQSAALESTSKDRDKIRGDLLRVSQRAERLEELSRALQAQKADIEASSKKRSEEDRERMILGQERMSAAIKDIQVKIDESSKDREKTLLENEELKSKLEDAFRHFKTYESLLEAKDQQFSAISEHSEALINREKELVGKMDALSSTNETLIRELASARQHITLLTELNDATRLQLKNQKESYEALESTISKVKKEIESSGKKQVELAKRLNQSDALALKLSEENVLLKQVVSQSSNILGQASGADPIGGLVDLVKRTKAKQEKLESMCRELMAKRNQAE